MNLILDLFFPKKCVGCKRFDTYFCQDCIRNIKQSDLVCPKCEKLAVGGQTHPVCRRRFGLDGLWSLGIYQDPLREAIKQFKYQQVSQFADVLSDVVIEYWVRFQPFILDTIKKDRGKGWVLIPVPLHWYRQNDRGFNQSSAMGKFISKKLGLDYSEALKRSRYTKSQAKLKSSARHQNIKGAFELSPSISISQYPNILLIDDVWTTGSTIRECCYTLKRGGAKKVWAITLAR